MDPDSSIYETSAIKFLNLCFQDRWSLKIENENNDTKTLTTEVSYMGVNSGPICSKLTTSLVNVSLKFQMLISQIQQYFLLKKCEKLYCNKKFQCIWL